MKQFGSLNRRNLLAGMGCMPILGCTSGAPMTSKAQGEFVTIDDKKLHYVIAGEGPPVILLHGASGNLRDWTFRRFDELSRNHQVLAFDRPGLGLSDAADDPSMVAQARLMRRAANELGVTNATLVGHSFGGSVALAWATDDPSSVNALVLLSAPSQVWPGSAGPIYDIARIPLLGYAFASLVPLIATDGVIARGVGTIYAPQPVPEGYLDHVLPELSTRPQTFRNNSAQVATLKEQIRQMVPLYGELDMPIELIHGVSDGVVPIEIHSDKFAQSVPGTRLTRLEGVGHMPHQTNPDALLQAIRRVA